MHDIRSHLFTKEIRSTKELTVTAKEGTFLFPDAEILVYRKQQFQRMLPHHIGDGMSIPLWYGKQSLENISPEAVLAGMSVYQEYDEQTDTWGTYLYKYAGGNEGRAAMQSYLTSTGTEYLVTLEDGFTRLSGSRISAAGFLSKDHSYIEQLSFLIGLCLGYGKPKQILEGRVMSRHIGLPLVGTIAALYEQIASLFASLASRGFFVVRSEQKQKFGSLIQYTIHDHEIITYLDSVWHGENKSPFVRYEQLLEKISVCLGNNDKRLHNSVLKFISK